MRVIRDGQRYDTETAEEILSWNNGRGYSDFRHRDKTLYRTKKGRYFLSHGGGPMTDMAVSSGDNSWGGSSSIEPISDEDAFEFLCSHEGEEAAERFFPDKITNA